MTYFLDPYSGKIKRSFEEPYGLAHGTDVSELTPDFVHDAYMKYMDTPGRSIDEETKIEVDLHKVEKCITKAYLHAENYGMSKWKSVHPEQRSISFNKGDWSNGKATDSDSVEEGSTPSSPSRQDASEAYFRDSLERSMQRNKDVYRHLADGQPASKIECPSHPGISISSCQWCNWIGFR